MSKRIVIIPTFASSHFIRCWIPNIIETLSPDIIIINEGLFPEGPENKGHIGDAFKEKWCHPVYISAGFDYDAIKQVVEYYNKDTWMVGCKPKVVLNVINHTSPDVNVCFLDAISITLSGYAEEGDIIFPLEPDAFLLETDKEIINEEISKLKPGQGLSCMWRDFLQTQYYCEAINEIRPKIRRFCYCFDTFQNYRSAMDGFMSQSYPKLKYTDKFWIRHYPWFVSGRWKELRYELIYRSNPQYWKDFENGLQEVHKMSQMYCDYLKPNADGTTNMSKMIPSKEILIRPSRQDEARWAKFIEIEHPAAIKSHPNFVK